ncbi:hypothetical protein [Xenorhabdus innexi]|nr:hypothetical protein [Xenorhabdus innexi]
MSDNLQQKFLSTDLAMNAITSIMRDDLPGENMKYCTAYNIAKQQPNEELPTGSLGVLFFPLLNRTFKKPLH